MRMLPRTELQEKTQHPDITVVLIIEMSQQAFRGTKSLKSLKD